MHIAQISDTHIKARNVRLFGSINVYQHFQQLVARIEALEPKPDLVIHTGDITNDGEVADYEAAMDCLSQLSMPVFVTLGNHDRREAARVGLNALPGIPGSGPFAYAIEDFPVRIVMADTLVEGAPHGKLGQAQLRWLDDTLRAAPDKPTLIGLHHPPFDTGIGFMDQIGLHDKSALAEVVAGQTQVKGVLAGHVHRPFTAAFAGTIAMICPGSAHQVAVDFTDGSPDGWTSDPPGFLLHQWNGKELVSVELPVAVSPTAPFSDDHLTVG